jgi:enoyl-[acyl-carrier protein] reductase III
MTGLLDPLAGRRFVVTGGTRGLGAAISRALVRRGARVDAWYRADRASADALTAALGAELAADPDRHPGEIHLHAGNLVEPAEIRRVCAAILARDPRVDGFVHCAALGSFKPLLEVRPAQWELTLDVGARGFLLCVQQLAPAMSTGGRVVALSSLGSQRVVPAYGALGIAKAALEALVRSLAVELAPRGIRVNALAAGPVAGTSIARHPGAAELLERSAARTPAGRLVTADEVADLVLLLLSPLAQGLCGQVLVADGGLSLVL